MSSSTSTRIGNNGRVVIPSEVRKQLGLNDGDVVQISVENDKVVITPRALLLDQLFETTRALRDARVDVVQELIDERRAEAQNE